MRALPGASARRDVAPPITRTETPDAQRRRILAVATELFAKRGYHQTTTERIVRRARVGYQTFYKLFPDKEACFLAIFDAAERRSAALLAEAYAETDGPWADKVAAAIAALFDAIAAQPALARVCLVEALTAGPAAVARYERAITALDPILRAGRRLSPRGEMLPDTLEQTLAGGVLWVAYQRLILNEAAQLATQLAETIEFVLGPYVGEAEAARAAHDLLRLRVAP